MAGFGPNLPPAIRAGGKPNAGPRQSAIAHHMGAPKQQQHVASKAPAGHPKPAAKPKAAPRPPKIGSGQKEIGTLNPGDVVNQSVTRARQERNVALAPLQSQANEIKGNEQGVQQRYGQLQGAQNTQLEKIQQGQEASAKTFQNQMAENALTQGKAIETAGQTQASMTGGYVSPELRAQQALSSQQAAGQGGAGSTFAQSVAASGASEIGQMRAAASLSALGGNQQIAGFFQKQLAANQAAQQGVIGKVGPRTTELEEKIGQTNYTDQLAKAKLASEGVKLNQAQQKINLYGKSIAGANKARAADAAYKQLEGKLKIAGLEGTERQRKIENGINSGKLKVSELSQQDKSAYDKWKQSQPGGSTTYSPATAAKFQSDVGKVASKIVTLTEGKTHNQTELNAAWKKLREEGIDDHVIHAAINKVRYNKFGPRDQAYMKSIGAER